MSFCSATKYFSGHSDAMGGSLAVNQKVYKKKHVIICVCVSWKEVAQYINAPQNEYIPFLFMQNH